MQGFVGTHLCERLLNKGNEVICLDNYFTGKKEKLNGWEPVVTLKEGLEKTVAYFDQLLKKEQF